MVGIRPPEKPFPDYKWRWASFQPTEGLNDPPVFLGVLRVFRSLEGTSPSSPILSAALNKVKEETGTRVNLVRTPERNLIRNSGQYWKALDLIKDIPGKIVLTDFGRRVADGAITSSELAATTIKTLELPNRNIDENVSDWEEAELTIKPLELILKILIALFDANGKGEAYITKDELVSIIIPLAGEKAPIGKHVEAISLYRRGKLEMSDWPNCAPGANDKRMAREFLLFLAHYGYCDVLSERGERFYLAEVELDEFRHLLKLDVEGGSFPTALETVRETDLPSEIERQRVLREIMVRPGQPQFRKKILDAFDRTCLITDNTLDAVLEAAHIIPVREKIIDTKGNGLCLRSDIHILYDSGHLRMDPDGNISLSEAAQSNYDTLPERVVIPEFVNRDYLTWRWKYY